MGKSDALGWWKEKEEKKKGAWREGGADPSWRKNPGSGRRPRRSASWVETNVMVTQGPWLTMSLLGKYKQPRNQYNVLANHPGPAASLCREMVIYCWGERDESDNGSESGRYSSRGKALV